MAAAAARGSGAGVRAGGAAVNEFKLPLYKLAGSGDRSRRDQGGFSRIGYLTSRGVGASSLILLLRNAILFPAGLPRISSPVYARPRRGSSCKRRCSCTSFDRLILAQEPFLCLLCGRPAEKYKLHQYHKQCTAPLWSIIGRPPVDSPSAVHEQNGKKDHVHSGRPAMHREGRGRGRGREGRNGNYCMKQHQA